MRILASIALGVLTGTGLGWWWTRSAPAPARPLHTRSDCAVQEEWVSCPHPTEPDPLPLLPALPTAGSEEDTPEHIRARHTQPVREALEDCVDRTVWMDCRTEPCVLAVAALPEDRPMHCFRSSGSRSARIMHRAATDPEGRTWMVATQAIGSESLESRASAIRLMDDLMEHVESGAFER